MDANVTPLTFLLAIFGCMIFSVALHYKKPGKDIEYGWRLGFAKNLTVFGKFMFFIGLILVLVSIGRLW